MKGTRKRMSDCIKQDGAERLLWILNAPKERLPEASRLASAIGRRRAVRLKEAIIINTRACTVRRVTR